VSLETQRLLVGYARNTTGDHSPPRPWAYLSGIGISRVTDAIITTTGGKFDVLVNGVLCHVEISTHEDGQSCVTES
jgi:hypothetical protein